jgi:hypothetical protein
VSEWNLKQNNLGMHQSDMFPLRKGLNQGDTLWQLFLKFTLKYAITTFQVNLNWLKLNVTHRLFLLITLIHWGGRTYCNENIFVFLGDIKETVLDVKAYKSKYIMVYCDQNAGQSTVQRMVIVHLQYWNSSNICKKLNESKLYSRRN